MASHAHLQLFPSPPKAPFQTRTSSLRKPPTQTDRHELQGLTLRVKVRSPPTVQPGHSTIKHSLFCDPPASPRKGSFSTRTPRHRNAQRRPSRPESLLLKDKDSASIEIEDQLSPLPTKTAFQNSSPPRLHPPKQLKTSGVPASDSTSHHTKTHDTSSDMDRLSPLPNRARFTPVSSKNTEFPGTVSLARSTSTKKTSPQIPDECAPPAPMRSMFPQYDPTIPMNAQSYYPVTHSPVQTLPPDKVSKLGSPVESHHLGRFDSAVSLVQGYEHVPLATNNDLISLWNASVAEHAKAPRKVQLGLFHRAERIALGTDGEHPLYSLEKALPQSPGQKVKNAKHVSIEKHCPLSGDSRPVAQLSISFGSPSDEKEPDSTVPVFPHQAAVYAIKTISNSPAAAEIAHFDPKGKSTEAARLAQDAVAIAHRRFNCSLSRTTRKRDSLGAVTAAYTLDHPALGALPITVTNAVKQRALPTKDTTVKISLHHPSATPAAIAAENLVLLSFDFRTEACIVDTPSLLALETPFLIDTAIAALFAVAALETSSISPTPSDLTFAPPPKSPLPPANAKSSKKAARRAEKQQRRKWSLRSTKVIDRAQRKLVGTPPDVGAPVEAAVALVALGLKMGVFVVEAGVNMCVKVASGG